MFANLLLSSFLIVMCVKSAQLAPASLRCVKDGFRGEGMRINLKNNKLMQEDAYFLFFDADLVLFLYKESRPFFGGLSE